MGPTLLFNSCSQYTIHQTPFGILNSQLRRSDNSETASASTSIFKHMERVPRGYGERTDSVRGGVEFGRKVVVNSPYRMTFSLRQRQPCAQILFGFLSASITILENLVRSNIWPFRHRRSLMFTLVISLY